MYLNLTSLHFIQDRMSLSKKACDIFFSPISCHALKSAEEASKAEPRGPELHKTHIEVVCVYLTVRYNTVLFIMQKNNSSRTD